MPKNVQILFLLFFLLFPACGASSDDDCAAWHWFEWSEFSFSPCLRGLTMTTGITRRSDPGCVAPELELRGVVQNPDPEPMVERGGGLPEALGVPRQGGAPFQSAYTTRDSSTRLISRSWESRWMDLQVEKVKDPMARIPEMELKQFLKYQRGRFEHRYQQKYPWAIPRTGEAIADRPGPEGRIYFYLIINTDRSVNRCRSLEPEALRGLGDRICSEMETWSFPETVPGAEGRALVEFEVNFHLRTFKCMDDGSGFLTMKWE